MKIVLLSLFLLCGQLLFANFSPPASAPHSLIYSQSIDNQLQVNFKTPLLPIEPAKPKPRNAETKMVNPFGAVPLLLLLGIGGMITFGLGLSSGVLWIWATGLGLESLIVLLSIIFGIIGAYEEAHSGADWVSIGTFYQLYILGLVLFFIPKTIQLFVLAGSLAMPLLTVLGFWAVVLTLVLLVVFLVSLDL